MGDCPPLSALLDIAKMTNPHMTAYVDTCIVSGLVKNELKPADKTALLCILTARETGEILLVTSEVTGLEIARISQEYRAPHEAAYQLLARVPIAPIYESTTRFLPDTNLAPFWREDALYL